MRKISILINLGSPENCDLSSIKKYLQQFLMDKHVIDIFWLWRFFLVNLFIVPFRSPKTLHAYQTVWDRERNLSPLIALTEDLCETLQKKTDKKILYAMRYGKPDIKSQIEYAVTNLQAEKIFFIPLYPHYAASTYLTAVEDIERSMQNCQIPYKIQDIFYNNSDYIEALVDQFQKNLQIDYDHLIFSYHGLPVRHLQKADPTKRHCYKIENCCQVNSEAHKFCYKHQVVKTTELFVKKAGIDPEKYSIAFQSKLGRAQWIEPSLTDEIERVKKLGKKKLAIICPSFVTDCLETLEEVQIGAKEQFSEGDSQREFQIIPCLNSNEKWLELLKTWIEKN